MAGEGFRDNGSAAHNQSCSELVFSQPVVPKVVMEDEDRCSQKTLYIWQLYILQTLFESFIIHNTKMFQCVLQSLHFFNFSYIGHPQYMRAILLASLAEIRQWFHCDYVWNPCAPEPVKSAVPHKCI